MKDDREMIMDLHRKYSECCRNKSLKEGIKQYWDRSMVWIAGGNKPLIGEEEYLGYYNKVAIKWADSSVSSWEAIDCDISGDMAYLYGTWKSESIESGELQGEGGFLEVWKKNSKGEWKLVADCASNGLGDYRSEV